MITRRLFSSLAGALPAAAAVAVTESDTAQNGSMLQQNIAAEPERFPSTPPAPPPSTPYPGQQINVQRPPRHMLLVYDVKRVDADALTDLGLVGLPYDVYLLPAVDIEPPVSIFALDGVPAFETGKLEALVAKAVGPNLEKALAQERERCALIAGRFNVQACGMADGLVCCDCRTARSIEAEIRGLTPATAVTQADELSLMSLAAEYARRHGDCTFRLQIAPDGNLQMQLV